MKEKPEQGIFFNARRSSNFNLKLTTISYEILTTSDGKNSIDATTGVFTVPINGTYQFIFNALAHQTSRVHLVLNGMNRATSYALKLNMLIMSSILRLKTGDKVSVFLNSGELYDSYDRFYTQFSGVLLSSE